MVAGLFSSTFNFNIFFLSDEISSTTSDAASWGSIIREGTRYMLVAPHLVLGPAVVLLAVVMSVNLLGDQLRDRMDVRGRVRGPGRN